MHVHDPCRPVDAVISSSAVYIKAKSKPSMLSAFVAPPSTSGSALDSVLLCTNRLGAKAPCSNCLLRYCCRLVAIGNPMLPRPAVQWVARRTYSRHIACIVLFQCGIYRCFMQVGCLRSLILQSPPVHPTTSFCISPDGMAALALPLSASIITRALCVLDLVDFS